MSALIFGTRRRVSLQIHELASIPQRIHPLADDPIDQLRIGQARLACGLRKVFVFRDRPTRRHDVLAFYGNATRVPPLAFAATIKDMKGLLHNG